MSEETTDDIVRDVQSRTAQANESMTRHLQELVALLKEKHKQKVQALLPIGYAMSATALADWEEIGRRMLAAPGGR